MPETNVDRPFLCAVIDSQEKISLKMDAARKRLFRL